MKCHICGAPVTRPCWRRDAPDDVFCEKCWLSDETDQKINRDWYAALLHKLRASGNSGRKQALELRSSLKGTGVPAKQKGGRHAA